jgi:hypothetical protein
MESFLLRLAALISALLIALGPQAFAEVSAQGTSEVARIEVKNASLEEVLRLLHDTYGLSYRSEVPLDARISGTYEGPLSQVVARLLDGKNYVLTKSGSNYRVVIIAEAGSRPIPSPASAPIPPPGGKAAASPQLPTNFFPPAPPPTPSARVK